MELLRQEAQASSSQRRTSDGDGDRGGFDRSAKEAEAELMSVDQCEAVAAVGDSRLVGVPVAIAAGGGAGEAVKLPEKRKRGRPPRGQAKAAAPQSRRMAVEEEEDVCFICFDGGSLVLCDRRNCPKAYHPACIKRDESFFKSRAKWNCGWHICSACQKASHYMCYTCTYSLCKGCTKDADYVCVRGNKGFCGTCMRTILLIENFEGNKEAVQVDFDDKTSWEYLFKVYWVLLKGNLSLTLDELLKATNPWTGPPASNWGSSGNSCPDLGVFNAKRRKINTKTNVLIAANSLPIEKSSGDMVTHPNGDTSWASKELLEFVAHMRNGNTSVMSRFDAQDLVLEYIKRNNLCDPQQKCQIVCDSRLLRMFGQARLGHIEMLKLLESHFLIKDDIPVNNTITAGLVEPVDGQMESVWDCDSQMTTANDKRRKIRKRIDEKEVPTNPDTYATIDVHNINLIFLRRNLLENLVDDEEKFHEKVVGAIVRIRIFSGDQKPDMHRLVRVVGTSKGTELYKIGTKETNVMLEILNLDKKEVIAIDGISNQEFSQDECERLRQSIKFGLIKRLTVGEIQAKAIALQEVKLNDWLESEITRLNHLRDRASEKGHRKELREYVEKLELLNSPEERKRRLEEVPIVHADPNMDPSYDFDHSTGELDQKKQDDKVKTRNYGSGRKRRASISPGRGGEILINCGSNGKNKATPTERSRDNGKFGVNGVKTLKNEDETDPTGSGTNQSVNDYEMYKIWHYQDPTGKIQGPFFMLQLRKWSSSGHFPPELRIWRVNEKHEDSILLTDALSGQCSKEQLLPPNSNLPLQEDKVASDDRKNNADSDSQSKSLDATPVIGEHAELSRNIELDDLSRNLEGSSEAAGSNGLRSNPSSTNTLALANSSDGHSMSVSEGWDSLKGSDVWPTQPHASSSPSAPVFLEKQKPSRQIGEDIVTERKSDQNDGNLNVWQNADCETRTNYGSENRSDGEDHSGQSSGQNWKPPVNSPTNDRDSNSGINSIAKSLETTEQNQVGIEFPNPPNLNVKPSNESPDGQAAENKQSVQDAGLSWSTASSLVGGSAQLHEVAGDSGGYSPSPAKLPVEEWESRLVSASSLKPKEKASDHAATPASISDHLTPSSPSHPHSNTSSWHDLVPDTDDFGSLMNESVSDLLAEVEAMESLHALSCHKVINYEGDLNEGSKTDCISPVEGFSPAPEPGKGDALSSTADIHLPPQSDVIDEALDAEVRKLEKSLEGHPAISPEVEGDTKHSDVSVNQWDTSADIQQVAPSTTGWDLEITDAPWNARSESMDTTSWGTVQTNAQMSWDGGLDQGNAVMDWGRATTQQTPNVNSGAPPSGGILGSQPRHSGDRYSGQRDRAYHARDSGFGRNRHVWNRQPYYGNGVSGGGSNGGGPFRAPQKGQRVCKFYENGYCKKGASCSYLHP